MAVPFDEVLDCSGLNCPMPIIKTKKAIGELELGAVLKMISTDPGSLNDMKAWAKKTGQELLETGEENGKFVFFIKRLK
ncbi:MAG: Sulfur carrier protein TusA [Anaerolineae bacterium]|nr:Sulfur carrier protein TusA [Anaerolineae bacterium]